MSGHGPSVQRFGGGSPALRALAVLILVLGLASVSAFAVAVHEEVSGGADDPPVTPRAAGCAPLLEVGQWPLRQRLGQLLMVGVDPDGPAEARELVSADQVGGIFVGGDATGLLSGNRLAAVQEVAELPVAVAVDDEGGRVQRFEAIVGPMPSARRMAATLSPLEVYEMARARGGALRAGGVTINLAPTVDVSDQPAHEVIGDRSFAADPRVVARYADAFARGMREAGVLPVFKHFPGHGRADGDSHRHPVSTPPREELDRVDLVPYRQLLTTRPSAVMVGHLDVPGLTSPSAPASVSAPVVDMLRRDLGHHGLVISDDLGAMRAITDRMELPEAVRLSLLAGVDMALWTSGDAPGPVLEHLERAVEAGTLPESRVDAAVVRVLEIKGVDPCRLP